MMAPADNLRPRGPSRAARLRPLQDLPVGQFVVHEIYASLQGEGTRAGLACTFLRLTACNLRCTYCDTPHAFGQGRRQSQAQVLTAIEALSPKMVLVTGGEPLLHTETPALMTTLCDRGYEVLLETSGSLSTEAIDPRIIVILDVKLPSSGEVQANRWDNMARLRPHDEVKFVIGDAQDFDYAKNVIAQYALHTRCHVLFGCVYDALAPATLAEWILRDQVPARLQLQMHKYIWNPSQRGV